MARVAPEFSLSNVGPGADPFTLESGESRFLVMFFQRDYYCTNCRQQVQAVADSIEEFRDCDALPVSILPEEAERAAEWQREYDLPYPLLADPDASVSAAYDQPVRFGALGRFSDFLGRMPELAIVDRRPDPPELAYVYRSTSTFDRPDVEEILAEIDSLREE
jgi:peroxiredoxin Q/BCP